MGAFAMLQLHLAQAKQALNRARNNSYSDNRKLKYQQRLQNVYNSLIERIHAQSSPTDQEVFDLYKLHLDFIFKSLEFLDNSTLNQIPYEIVACLDYALQDWVDKGDDFIIVTSLINDLSGFSFDPSLAFNEPLYDDIKQVHKIDFDSRLVQINLPKALVRDYFATVVLYHELGHFVDQKYRFTESLTQALIQEILSGRLPANVESDLSVFLPSISGLRSNAIDIRDFGVITQNYLAEYFCDLFAAQYVGASSNHYLSYITALDNTFSLSHPATTARLQVVDDFLNGNHNVVVDLLNQALQQIRSAKLEKRYDAVAPDDFFRLIPINITNERELHGLFDMAWQLWLSRQSDLANAISDQSVTKLPLYNIVNNLVEKSIGNYITLEKWKKAHQPKAPAPVV